MVVGDKTIRAEEAGKFSSERAREYGWRWGGYVEEGGRWFRESAVEAGSDEAKV